MLNPSSKHMTSFPGDSSSSCSDHYTSTPGKWDCRAPSLGSRGELCIWESSPELSHSRLRRRGWHLHTVGDTKSLELLFTEVVELARAPVLGKRPNRGSRQGLPSAPLLPLSQISAPGSLPGSALVPLKGILSLGPLGVLFVCFFQFY